MNIDLQAQLALSVRKYLDTQNPWSDERDEALAESCSTLGWMLNGLLDGVDGWSRWIAIDIMGAETVTTEGPDQLQIEGSATWMDETRYGEEPFFASLRVSQSGDAVIGYTIKFADADRGLVATPPAPRNEKKRQHLWLRKPEKRKHPEKWMFEFRGPSTPGEHKAT